jgi:rhodanese-related sulfurtransferase
MPFDPADVAANRAFFESKLRAFRQKIDLVHRVKGEGDSGPAFVLIDVRSRDAYEKGHIPGALSVPLESLDALAPRLNRDDELVVVCWNDY